MESDVYGEAYRRLIAVIKSVGAIFEEMPETGGMRIASKLQDQDICLSMMDKLSMKREKEISSQNKANVVNDSFQKSETADTNNHENPEVATKCNNTTSQGGEQDGRGKKRRLRFWIKEKENVTGDEEKVEEEKETDPQLTTDDLGAVLLSVEEPTMTRQLNSLSNIVQRALLFGGDQELLVLSETLTANRPAFVERWYPGTGQANENLMEDNRHGVQYLNALILILREAYDQGIVTTLDPFVSLTPSYANAYERLIATCVELGSGYIKPAVSDVKSMPKPRTAQEELGRFAVWETTFRANSAREKALPAYPEDLEGKWEVKDEVGGKTIGVSTLVFGPEGTVQVAPPLQGLRWRLDPGPTHLDTCTFQVLGEDGTILQYRGFVDRGARLESRFSKRPLKIRGSVMFQMRDGDAAMAGEGYWKDVLPINYKTGTTKFVMTKIMD